MRTFERTNVVRDRAGLLVASIVAVYLLSINASLDRPIWVDEFLHFAVAAAPSTSDAWAIIRDSIREVNHGQTGVYMIADYWLLSSFGAKLWALRLPSLLSGIFLLFCLFILFRLRRIPSAWLVLMMVALIGQSSAMYYLGEARPYFPLVAACVGTYLYYSVDGSERSLAISAIGYIAMTIGVLFHPYFAMYWPVLLICGYVSAATEANRRLAFRDVLAHANLPLCVAGAAIFLCLASLTWFRQSPHFLLDPFELIREPSPWRHFLSFWHFQFAAQHLLLATLCILALAGLILAMPETARGSVRGLRGPVLLLTMSIVVSIALSFVSFARSYWILPRQWIGSVILVPIATVMLWAEMGRILARVRPALGVFVWMACAGLLVHQAYRSQSILRAELASIPRPDMGDDISCAQPPTVPPEDPDIQRGNATWQRLANANVRCGGPVWPVFLRYYRPAGSS